MTAEDPSPGGHRRDTHTRQHWTMARGRGAHTQRHQCDDERDDGGLEEHVTGGHVPTGEEKKEDGRGGEGRQNKFEVMMCQFLKHHSPHLKKGIKLYGGR